MNDATALTFSVKGKVKRPQSLCQLRGRCITITIPHNTVCFRDEIIEK